MYSSNRIKIWADEVAGRVGVIDGEDVRVVEDFDQVRIGEVFGGATKGGDVTKVVGVLPGEHAVELAFSEQEGWMAESGIGAILAGQHAPSAFAEFLFPYTSRISSQVFDQILHISGLPLY